MDVLLKKQKITIKTSEEPLAFQLRKITNESLKNDIQRMIECVFSQQGSSSTDLYIDKLFLDLGDLSLGAFQTEFVALAEAKLIEKLNVLFEGDELQGTSRERGSESSYGASPNISSRASYSLRSQKQTELDALLFFLENGIFPWWFQPETTKQSPPDLLEKTLGDQAEGLVLRLFSFKKTKSGQTLQNIISRLFVYSKESLYRPVIESLTSLLNDKRLAENVKLIIKNTHQINKAIFTKDPLSTQDFHQFLFNAIFLHGSERRENFLYHFLRQLLETAKAATEDYPLKLDSLSEAELKAVLLKITKDEERHSRSVDETGKRRTDDPSTIRISDRTVPDEPNGPLKSLGEEKITESIYINNAGLLLLHPFLPALFEQSGLLTEGNSFASPRAQQKGAVLLFYLQSGDSQYKEWEMPLNKLLCGLDYRDLLEDNLLISDKDRENCDQLLEAVIEHWQALKGASIAALRQTFLLREGKLSQKEEHWLVQVERTGVDILLDRLPWGYGVIKLPWLKNIVFTEW